MLGVGIELSNKISRNCLLNIINHQNNAKRENDKELDNSGFTLIEIIIVVSIITILTAIVAPIFQGCINEIKRVVCETNCSQLKKMYETSLILEGTGHSEAMFIQYLQDYGRVICPDGGDISYRDGEVQCSVHPKSDGNDSDGSDDGGVPFL